MEEINIIRNQINQIDDELVDLFLRRMDRVREVGKLKKNNLLGIIDNEREEQIFKKHILGVEDDAKRKYIKDFLEGLIGISKKSQADLFNVKAEREEGNIDFKLVTVGFQGINGSFSHEALTEYFETKPRTKNYNSFKEVFEALKNKEIKYGILPIENTTTGGISDVYDLLNIYNCFIIGEKCMGIDHNLLGIPGTTIEMLNEIYSHPQGFLQCSNFFENHGSLKQITYFNTANSAKYISDKKSKSLGCVASRKACELYGLEVIKENINNYQNNKTRFVVISRGMVPCVENDKISMVMILPHKVGVLHSVLKNFTDNNINMMKIESRPIAEKAFRYYFYIDIEGNLKDNYVDKALKQIEKETIYFKLLGNYKADLI